MKKGLIMMIVFVRNFQLMKMFVRFVKIVTTLGATSVNLNQLELKVVLNIQTKLIVFSAIKICSFRTTDALRWSQLILF